MEQEISWKYSEYTRIYGELIDNCEPAYLFLAKKWQDLDLIWPYSDLDFRIVLSNTPFNWFLLNEALYKIHYQLVEKDQTLIRILEHPPGFIFTRPELEAGLGNVSDIAIWSYGHGSEKHYQKIKTRYSNQPWLLHWDDKFYGTIIKKRFQRFNFKNEFDNGEVIDIDKYWLYCICWHYYGPCVYALNCLLARRRLEGKFYALNFNPMDTVTHHTVMGLLTSRFELAFDKDRLIGLVNEAIDKMLAASGLKNEILVTNRTDLLVTMELSQVISMLRVRICRYLFYLYPPPNVETDFMIRRETDELKSIMDTILSAPGWEDSGFYKVASQIRDRIGNRLLEKMDLYQILKIFYRHKQLVNDVLNGEQLLCATPLKLSR